MSRGARISAVVGSVLAGAVLGLIGYMFLTNAPVYQHQYYRDANEWFGLRFFLELPIMACLFALLFGLIAGKAHGWQAAAGMLLGVALAYVGIFLSIYAYVPQEASLTGDNVSLSFLLGWVAASALLAWLGGRIARRLARE
jgi:hypothetical protein